MPRKTTSLKVDEDLWKRVKKHCIDKDIDVSDYVESLIKNDLSKNK
jgi:hypothetical protein